MKKTLWALLLALVMVLTVSVAMAECDHSSGNQKREFEYVGCTTTMKLICTDCNGVKSESSWTSHSWVNGACSCGAVCDHASATPEDSVCPTCAMDVAVDEPETTECDHQWVYTEEPTKGVHWKSCSKCDMDAVKETCIGCDFTDGCSLCGSPLYGIHPNDGTDHCKYCRNCLEHDENANCPLHEHVWVNGKCECGADEVVPCDHDLVLVKELAPTCIEAGYEWWECSKCDYEENGAVGRPTGIHTYENGICTGCGAADEAHEHIWVNGKCECGAENPDAAVDCEHAGEVRYDIYESTCVKNGYKNTICKECGSVIDVEELPLSTEHVYRDGKCLLCGADEIIPCEHDYEVVKELAPTCVEAGYEWLECSKCGAEKNHEVGRPTGIHTYEEGVCTVCGAEDPDYVAPTPVPTPKPTPKPTPVPPVVTPEPTPEVTPEPEQPDTWLYGNTMTAYGPTTRELVGGSDWYRVTPVDLSADGVYTYDLIASNRYVVGTVTITVADGALTVSYNCKAYPHEILDETLLVYASKADLAEGKAVSANVDEAISIAENFGSDTKVIVSLILTANYDAEGHNVVSMSVDADEIAAMIASMD